MSDATYVVVHSFTFQDVEYHRSHVLDAGVVAALSSSKPQTLQRHCRAVNAQIAARATVGAQPSASGNAAASAPVSTPAPARAEEK